MLNKILLFWCAVILYTPLLAQKKSEILGRTVDAVTHETLPFVDVFINNTTLATSTDDNGNFELSNIPYGVHELVMAYAGYEPIQVYIPVNAEQIDFGFVEMKPLDQLLGKQANGPPDSGWEKSLKKFKSVFLGESEFANQCEILNPYVISFTKQPGGIILGSATEPIEISNMALGYKMSYFLDYFEATKDDASFAGKVSFSEISTKGGVTALKWINNRKETFIGSPQHLFKAIINHQIKNEGFYLYTVDSKNQGTASHGSFMSELGTEIFPFDTVGIVFKGKIPNTYKVVLKGKLEIHAHGKLAVQKTYSDVPYPVSWIDADGDTVFVNPNGVVLNPQEISFRGAMGNHQLANLLPSDYAIEKIVTIQKEIKEVAAKRLEEKVYVQLDKPYYYPGEMMWFKAYLNYRYPALRDSMSRTLYVELINGARKIVKSAMLRIDDGMANGNWIITDSLSSGNYYLRAYTNLNKNFDNQFIFVKPIPILGKTYAVVESEKYDESINSNRLTIQPDKKLYKTRDSISIELIVKDKGGAPLKSKLSISVTDARQVLPVRESMTIIAGFPFQQAPSSAILKDVKYPVEYGISYLGQYFNRKGKPEKTTLNILQGNYEHLSVIETEDNGVFSENGLIFYDSSEFRFQVSADKKNSGGRVEIMSKEFPPLDFNFPNYQLKTFDTGRNQRLISEYEVPRGARLLSEVLIKGKKEQEEKQRPYGKPDYVVTAKELDISSNNLLLILQGKVPGLIITTLTDNTGVHSVVRIARASGLTIQAQTEPLVMVDNVPLSGRAGDILQSIDAYTIESIEVVTRVSPAYGSAGVNGVIALYTKQGGAAYQPPIKSLQVSKLRGYTRTDAFRFPNYGKDKELNQIDYRSILYWNPFVLTDKTGKTKLSFYAADLEAQYRIVVEGIDENYEPVRGVHYITVSKGKQN